MFSYPDKIKIKELENIYALCDSLHLDDDNVLSTDAFTWWFYENLYATNSIIPNSTGLKIVRTRPTGNMLAQTPAVDGGNGTGDQESTTAADAEKEALQDSAAQEILQQLEAMDDAEEPGSPTATW